MIRRTHRPTESNYHDSAIISAFKNRKSMKTDAGRRVLRPIDYTIIVLTLGSAVAYSVIQHRVDIMGTVALLFGVTGTVLSARRSIWNFVFGTVNVALYAVIAYNASNYGQAALNALYYLPMQFVGWWAWSRRKDSADRSRVKARSMTGRQMLLCLAAAAVAIAAVWYTMRTLTDAAQPFKDSFITVVFVIGQVLMTFAFWQQWLFWIAGNIANIALWGIVMADGEIVGGLMVIKYSMYLINSVGGAITWRRTAAE